MSGFLDYPLVPDWYKNGGGIHIKPSKRGTFTKAAKRRGLTVKEFADRVLSNKGKYSSAMVKKANFARNASKWHADGGPIDYSGIVTTNNRPYNADYIAYIDKALRRGGMNPMQRASVLANIIEESGGDPFAEGPGGFYGLVQWSGDRYKKTGEKDAYKEIDNQVKTILDTAGNSTDRISWTHGGKGSGYNSFKDAMDAYNGDDLAGVMRGYTLGYVRPAGGVSSYNNRLKVAEQIYGLDGFNTFDAGGFIDKYGEKRVKAALDKLYSDGGFANKFQDGGDEGEEYYDDTRIKAPVVTATLPSINSKSGKTIAKNMAQRVASGQMRLTEVPGKYLSYVDGEVKGAMPTTRAIDRAGETLFPVVGGLAFGPAGAIGAVAGEALNMGVNAISGGKKNTWGDLFADPEKHPVWNTAWQFTNPGYMIAGGSEAYGEIENALNNSRKFQKIGKLYSFGRNPRLEKEAFDVEKYRTPARKMATETKSFSESEKAETAARVISGEKERAERIFGAKYDDVFNKHATSPELKKLFRENPEYLYYVEQTGLEPLAQSTVDAFANRQMRSVRGFALKDSTDELIKKAATEFKESGNPGGDQLQTSGGVYSSNSYKLADKFRRGQQDIDVDNIIVRIQYPYVPSSGSVRSQLGRLRDRIINRDDWYVATNALLHDRPNIEPYDFVESDYAKRLFGGDYDVFQRATTKPGNVESLNIIKQHGLPDYHNRWGTSGIENSSADNMLFIPKVTTRADLGKLLAAGRQVFHRDKYDDYLNNIVNQNKTRMSLIHNSIPYKLGKHIYDNTAIVGGKEVYAPLIGVSGAAALGATGIAAVKKLNKKR